MRASTSASMKRARRSSSVNMNPCRLDAGFAASARAGLSYEDLIGRIVEASLERLQATA
jgi:hypothetical protein